MSAMPSMKAVASRWTMVPSTPQSAMMMASPADLDYWAGTAEGEAAKETPLWNGASAEKSDHHQEDLRDKASWQEQIYSRHRNLKRPLA